MRNKLNPTVFFTVLGLFLTLLIFSRSQVMKTASEQGGESSTKQIGKSVVKEDKKTKVVSELLSKMTLEEKVGQLFWARVPAYNQIEDIQTYHLGGYLLFGTNFEGLDLEGVKSLTDSYQNAATIPMLIGSDEEGGTVTRISSILEIPFDSPLNLYAMGGLEAVLEDSKSKAELLKSVGINAGLYPVADLPIDPYSFIYDRTIGQDAKETSKYIQQIVKSLNEAKVGSTLKHFPGYGDNGDSHTDVIEDNRSLKTLRQADLLPFKAGIEAGADSVLVSHNILTEIDDVPASISPKITAILRDELTFDGVVMTDDFDMAGLADLISQEEAAYQSIAAGNDLVLSSTYHTQIPYLLEKVSSGELTEKRIDESVTRILKWKYDLGLLR